MAWVICIKVTFYPAMEKDSKYMKTAKVMNTFIRQVGTGGDGIEFLEA